MAKKSKKGEILAKSKALSLSKKGKNSSLSRGDNLAESLSSNKGKSKVLSPSQVSIVILAAGLGTRMKSATPKVLQRLCGKAMILHILKQAFCVSDDVSVVLYHQKEQVSAAICAKFPRTKIIVQDHLNFPGTAGALRDYAPKHDKIIVLCGDMPLIKAASLQEMLKIKSRLAVAVFESKEPKNYGRVIIKKDKIAKIVEFKDASEKERLVNTCNSGVYVLESAILKELLPQIQNQNAAKEYYLTDIVGLAKAKGESVAPVFVSEAEFMGVNDKIELARAENLMQEDFKEALMREGVIFHNPQSSFISLDAKFIGECEIYEGVRIEGKTVIEGSIIESSSLIRDSSIKNSHIKALSVIEESVVEGSDLGPLAHLRPKCEIKNSHIGNFVECKNAILQGVKAGHLSYLGDCEVGEGSNIGCGTITCNYDGLKKHRTIIGKNVFVGSDTQLIAPVSVADDVIIAAGSCVTSDVPSGALFINRAEKKIIKDYFYQKFGLKKG